LFFTIEYTPGQGKIGLIGACVFAALACLTRYVGLTVVMACMVGVGLINPFGWKEKLKNTVIFCTASLVPLGLWYARDWLLTGNLTNRTLIFHWPGQPALDEAIMTAAAWFLPGHFTLRTGKIFLLTTVLVTVAAFIAWWLSRRSRAFTPRENNAFRLSWVLAAFILVYCVNLLLSRAYFDASTRWNTRILSPLLITGGLLFCIAIWYGTRAHRWLWGKILLGGIGLYLVWLNLPVSNAFLYEYALNGMGYTNRVMQTSPAMTDIKNQAGSGFIFSNNAAAIYFNTGKVADWIPEKFDSVKALPRPEYERNLAEMRLELEKPGSLLVIFLPYYPQVELPSLSELTQGLVELKSYPDAILYALPAK
jgi:hypothetical protein